MSKKMNVSVILKTKELQLTIKSASLLLLLLLFQLNNVLAVGLSITSFSPAKAKVGSIVTINGTGFVVDGTTVKFGNANARVNPGGTTTQMQVVVPLMGTTDVITIMTQNPFAVATSASIFTILPSITSVSPINQKGAFGSSVGITGGGYSTTAANNIVYFGAVKATVTSAAAFELGVTVPIGANYQNISVTNLSTGLTAYSALPFIPTFSGSMAFAAKVDFATGTSPTATAMGDIDGDGKPDMLTANLNSSTISIFRNTSTSGSVSFADTVNLISTTGPRNVSLADLNGDGKLDIVISSMISSTMSVFRNTSTSGSISFASRQDISIPYPWGVTFGDFNSDGMPDLAVVGVFSSKVSVYPNTSTTGNISFGTVVEITTGAGPTKICVGDFESDGKPDIAVTNKGANTISVFRNLSSGIVINFASKVDLPTGSEPNYIVIGDIDGDRKPDLVVANSGVGDNTVSVLRNTSTSGVWSFASKEDLVCFAGTEPQTVCIGDIDGDGKPDIAVAGNTAGKLMIFKNTSTSGTLSFDTRTDITSESSIVELSIIDIDGDGKQDIVESNFTTSMMSVFRQVSLPVISSFTPTAAGNGTTVEITGANFTGATDVSFGGTAAASFIENSSTSISAVVAAGATGTISVTTSAGTGFSTDTFTYTIIPLLSTQAVSSIASTTATGNGNITDIGAATPATRGSIWYSYTNTDKIISDAGVTNVPEAGSFSTGTFTSSLTGLAANTHYNTRAYATNSYGTGYGARVAFRTLANVPSAPTVNNPTATSLDVAVNVNSNPEATEFAIQDSVNGTFVQAAGTMGASAVWQTASAWGTKTVTGLTTAITYYYRVKARNADSVETAYSVATSGIPVSAPSVEWLANSGAWLETQPAGESDKNWCSVSVSGDGMKMLAGVQNGRLYLSTNGGTSWSETQPAGAANKFWKSVSVSGNGLKMLAGVQNGRLYLSTDGGTSWSETQPDGATDKVWTCVSVSGNGLTMLAGLSGGRLYKSSDGGTNWSEAQPAGNSDNNWVSVAASGDGITLLAAVSGGRLYKSIDGGTNWSETQPAGVSDLYWQAVAVSSNGMTTLAGVNGGRLYKSTDGGTNWSETQPAGESDLYWQSISVSGDGQKMLAGVFSGRLYKSTDGGTNWSETQPAGETDQYWYSISVSGDGQIMLAPVYNGRLFISSSAIFKPITATTATATGNITATNGADATNRGAIWYEYTDTDKIIGDAGVTNVSNDGSFGTGTYTFTLSSLTPNTRYNARAHATNPYGTGYSVRTDFRTLANVPSAPTVNNPTATTLDIAVNVNSNPEATEFAIQDSVNGTFVQAGGTMGATAVWQTTTAWGTKTVTGLTTAMTYYYRVKARNADNVETAYGAITDGTPVDKPSIVWEPLGTTWLEIQPSGASDQNWASVSVSGDGQIMLAGVMPGRLYKSTDGGTSWIEAQPAGASDKNWSSVSVSGDGQIMLAGVLYGRLYKSTDGGTSWSEAQPAGPAKFWKSVSVSGDGLKMLACVQFGRLYISTDGGTNWSETQPAGASDKNWKSVSVSGDGSKMLACIDEGRFYKSTDGGTSWSETQPAGNADKRWNSVSVSGDGQIMLAGVYDSRLYKSTDGGTSWSETQPAGASDKKWAPVSVSGDGQIMLAGVYYGRLYKSTDGGTSWNEAQPAGASDKQWGSVSVSGDGTKLLAGVYGGRLYNSVPVIFNPITATTALASGNISATNGADASNRGLILYPYTDSDKEIDGIDVTNFDETGTFGTGTYTFTLSPLTVNTRYKARAHATNTYGTGYSTSSDFWTLANVPDSPTVNNPTATSLDVAVNVNSNPEATEFAIQDSVNGTYVQINGTLAADTVWQTATAWGTKTVTGLSTGVTYYFRVKARNGNNTETAFSFSTGQNTCSNPTNAGEIDGEQTICYNTEAAELGSVTEASDYGGTLEYQWQSNTTSSTFTFDDIIGASSNTYSPGTRTQTSWFRRLARVSCKDDWTGAAISNVIKVTVDPATVSGSISGNDSTIVHTTTGDLTLSGQTGNVLQWEKKLNTGNWESIPGTAITTYSDTPLTVGEWYYRALVQSGVCSSTYTSDYMVEVIPDVPEHFTLSSPGTATAGYASGNFVISLFDQYDNPTYCRANTTFNLSTNSTSSTHIFTPASPLQMGTGTYSSTFTYTESKAGTHNITASYVSGSSGLAGETLTVSITVTLPVPWVQTSIGASNGTTEFFPEVNAGTYKQTAQGLSAPKSDVMNFVYQQLCGNGTVIARLSDVVNGGWAGVMMRESNAVGSKTVLFKTKLYNPMANVGVRSTTNGNISNTTQNLPNIHWMKIQRTSSNTFKIYTSYDGTTWIRRYTATVAMNNCINAGFFTENAVSGRTTTTWIDHAEVVGYLKDTEEENADIISNDLFEVMVYPNPASDHVSISIPENDKKVKVTLINASGLVVETSEFNTMEVEYYINHIKPGMYLLRFERDGMIVNKRLVVL